ncbi:MAG: tetratricopeptide repeat protein [Acidobacteria bacterium]|nr:tetratricopeptide repeat protein [Acidobacteriota bacterium]
MLAPFWDEFAQFPNTIGLNDEESADVFLRFGGVIGFLGNTQKIRGSQEISKNLLTQARQRFLTLGRTEKAAEAENYLALAYSRTGEYTEAVDWLTESFEKKIAENHPTRLYSYIIETLLDIETEKYDRVLARGARLDELFRSTADNLLCGCFYNHIAIAHKNLGHKNAALENLKAARTFFQKADHQIYFGAAENNLAQLFHKVGNFEEAHLAAKKARMIFEKIGDRVREGFSLETRAQIFSAEGKYEQALKYIDAAIEMLEGGESYRKLVDSYRTKIGILLRLERLSESLMVMTAAHNLAALYISPDLSREIIEGTSELIRAHFEKNEAYVS